MASNSPATVDSQALNTIDISRWVEAASPTQRKFREAIHLILSAIETDVELRGNMVMKGGILMALRYHSPRFTRDIDFSTPFTRTEFDEVKFEKRFAFSLAAQVADSDYDLDCRIQSFRILPANRPDASFPSVKLTIGYAPKGTPKHERLLRKQCSDVISIDYSLNERILAQDEVQMGRGSLQVYAFTDLVAEKFRSLLQQEVRNRYRRQDIYDLNLLIRDYVSLDDKKAILESLIEKSLAREIVPNRSSLSESGIRNRAGADYHTLLDEIEGVLPDFDASYNNVESFYRSLPWPE